MRANAALVVGAVLVIFVLGCKKKEDTNADAAADAAVEAAVEDAGSTAAVEDAAVEATAPVVTAVKTAAPAPALVGLPKSCVDSKGNLGTLTFAVSGTNVTITSSSTKAVAKCTKKDEQLLICDWTGMDGKPSVSGRKVTYGPKRTIGGNFDTTHIFSCPPQ